MLWSLLWGALLPFHAGHARAEAPLPGADRIMLVVAHQDDNIMVMVPDLVNALRAGKAVQTVFVTSGDAGFTCDAYTEGREQGAKLALARLLGVQSRWSEEERSVNGKRVRFSFLANSAVSFAHIGLPNPGLFSAQPPEGALAKLWSREIAQVSTLPYDGRSRLDNYTREDLIEVLRALMVQFAPKDVRTLDASQQQLPYYPFEHVDHMGSAMFAFAAFQRYTLADSVTFYPLYSVLFQSENLSSSSTSLRRDMFDTYRQHDPAPCATESSLTTTICGETTLCDPLFLYDPLWPRSYPDDTVRGASKLLRTPGGGCLDVVNGAVVASLCNALRTNQRWELARGGSVRNVGANKCLAAASANAGQALSLRSCAREPGQQFYLTTQRQLRGPDATCVREWFGQVQLAECALDDTQRDFLLQ
jgi:LmbE family N-acetylglucosaminyl deacetylase